jgi:acyl-CoA reductase-like NAD-dependent aldehyde dehydrogenase
MPAGSATSASRTPLKAGVALPAPGAVPTPLPFTGEQFAPALQLAKDDARQASGTYEPPVAPGLVPDASPALAGYSDANRRMHAERLSNAHPWEVMDVRERLRWVARFRALLALHREQLCKLMEDEIAKPFEEGLLTDVAPLLAACKWVEKNAPRLLGARSVPGAPFWLKAKVRELRVPLGKVAIIATWNYPVQLLGIQVVHALIAGNRVVVKPSERSPRTQNRLLELAVEAGLPPGTLEWTGHSREAGATMLATRTFDHVVFTGSSEVGQRIATTLAKSMTPATLELSGRDTAFVLADADAKKAARCLWAATCVNAGQTCMAPRRVLVVGDVYDKLVAELARLAATAKPRALIDERAANTCKELVAKAIGRGARDLGLHHTDPAALAINVPSDEVDRFFRPTVLAPCEPTLEVVQGKHFGPLLAVVRCINIEEALRIHGQCDQHLVACVFTRDARVGELLGKRLGLTTVLINDCIMPTGHPGVSIGGSGLSGQGVSRGAEGLLSMTHVSHIALGKHGLAQMAKPLPQWQLGWLSKMLGWWYGAGKAHSMPRAGEASAPTPAPASAPRAAEGSLPLPQAAEGAPTPIVHSAPPGIAGKRPL